MYRDCTIDTNELLNTLVFTDIDGKIVVQVGHESLNNESVNNVKCIKRQEKKKMSDETTNPTQSQPQPAAPKVKSTAGVLSIAKKMITEGKDTEVIMQALIAAYMSGGKDAKQAKHNAQSCLFNARKKLAPKAAKTDPTPAPGIETAATTPTAPVAETPVVAVPVEKGPETEVEVEETTTNGTPVDDGGETEVEA